MQYFCKNLIFINQYIYTIKTYTHHVCRYNIVSTILLCFTGWLKFVRIIFIQCCATTHVCFKRAPLFSDHILLHVQHILLIFCERSSTRRGRIFDSTFILLHKNYMVAIFSDRSSKFFVQTKYVIIYKKGSIVVIFMA